MRAASPSVSRVAGRIVSFNLSPKGLPEGMIVRPDGSDDVVQVNFPPELAGPVTQAVAEGAAVGLDVEPFRDAEQGPHPVFDLVRLDAGNGRAVTADGDAEADVTVRGTVARINFARRGEPNGGVLDTGDFVHLRPHGFRAVALEVGQTLEATGEVRPGWAGHRVIEARAANGARIEKPHKPEHHGHHPKRGPKPKPHGHHEH